MIRAALLIALFLTLGGCAFEESPPASRSRPQLDAALPGTPRDPIDVLVAQLSKTAGMWLNGSSPVLELPEEAPIEDLVTEFFQKVSYEGGPIGSTTIEEIRPVTIPPGHPDDQYTAVLVRTHLGRKVLLLQYSKSGGWRCRVYDV